MDLPIEDAQKNKESHLNPRRASLQAFGAKMRSLSGSIKTDHPAEDCVSSGNRSSIAGTDTKSPMQKTIPNLDSYASDKKKRRSSKLLGNLMSRASSRNPPSSASSSLEKHQGGRSEYEIYPQGMAQTEDISPWELDTPKRSFSSSAAAYRPNNTQSEAIQHVRPHLRPTTTNSRRLSKNSPNGSTSPSTMYFFDGANEQEDSSSFSLKSFRNIRQDSHSAPQDMRSRQESGHSTSQSFYSAEALPRSPLESISVLSESPTLSASSPTFKTASPRRVSNASGEGRRTPSGSISVGTFLRSAARSRHDLEKSEMEQSENLGRERKSVVNNEQSHKRTTSVPIYRPLTPSGSGARSPQEELAVLEADVARQRASSIVLNDSSEDLQRKNPVGALGLSDSVDPQSAAPFKRKETGYFPLISTWRSSRVTQKPESETLMDRLTQLERQCQQQITPPIRPWMDVNGIIDASEEHPRKPEMDHSNCESNQRLERQVMDNAHYPRPISTSSDGAACPKETTLSYVQCDGQESPSSIQQFEDSLVDPHVFSVTPDHCAQDPRNDAAKTSAEGITTRVDEKNLTRTNTDASVLANDESLSHRSSISIPADHSHQRREGDNFVPVERTTSIRPGEKNPWGPSSSTSARTKNEELLAFHEQHAPSLSAAHSRSELGTAHTSRIAWPTPPCIEPSYYSRLSAIQQHSIFEQHRKAAEFALTEYLRLMTGTIPPEAMIQPKGLFSSSVDDSNYPQERMKGHVRSKSFSAQSPHSVSSRRRSGTSWAASQSREPVPPLPITQIPPLLTFVTGDLNVLREVKSVLVPQGSRLGLFLTHSQLDLPEIQGAPIMVARAKCKAAVQKLNGPCLTEDTALVYNALGDLPGPYIKQFASSLGVWGLVKLLHNFSENHSAQVICTLGYAVNGREEPMVFQGIIEGTIVEPRGKFTSEWDSIFQPNCSHKTLGEMSEVEKAAISHRSKALAKLRAHLRTHPLRLGVGVTGTVSEAEKHVSPANGASQVDETKTQSTERFAGHARSKSVDRQSWGSTRRTRRISSALIESKSFLRRGSSEQPVAPLHKVKSMSK